MNKYVEVLFEKTALRDQERRAVRQELGRKGRGQVISRGLGVDISGVESAAAARHAQWNAGNQRLGTKMGRGGGANRLITGTPTPKLSATPVAASAAHTGYAGATPIKGFRARAGNLFGRAMNRFGRMGNLGKAGVIGAGLAGAGLVGSMVGSAFNQTKQASLQGVYNQAFENEFLKLAKGA